MIKIYQAVNGVLRTYIILNSTTYIVVSFTPTYSTIGTASRNYIDEFFQKNPQDLGSWDQVSIKARQDAIIKIFEKFLNEDNEWQNMQMLLEVKLSTTSRQYNIKKWNDEQKKLWLKVVDKLKIDKNNVQMFLKFGQEFYDYVNKNDEIPTMKQMIGVLK